MKKKTQRKTVAYFQTSVLIYLMDTCCWVSSKIVFREKKIYIRILSKMILSSSPAAIRSSMNTKNREKKKIVNIERMNWVICKISDKPDILWYHPFFFITLLYGRFIQSHHSTLFPSIHHTCIIVMDYNL